MLFRRFRNTSSFSDEDLVERYRDTGDAFYVGELYKRYTHLAYGVCMKYLKDTEESKDCVMQIFEKLLDDLRKHKVENFKSWLHSVCRNHCLMKLRKQEIRVPFDEAAENIRAVMESQDELHLLNETELTLQKLEEAIHCLNDPQKTCVELFYLKEKSYQQITLETGYSLNEVKSHLQNARRNLKNYMSTKE